MSLLDDNMPDIFICDESLKQIGFSPLCSRNLYSKPITITTPVHKELIYVVIFYELETKSIRYSWHDFWGTHHQRLFDIKTIPDIIEYTQEDYICKYLGLK